MPGKKRKLTDEQIAKAQRLVNEGYKMADVAKRFDVTAKDLAHYGVKAPEKYSRGKYSRLPRA